MCGGNPKHSSRLSLIVDVLEFRGLASSLTERRGCVKLTFDWFKVESPAPRLLMFFLHYIKFDSGVFSVVHERGFESADARLNCSD